MNDIQKYLAELGRKGGAATAKNRTPKQRQEAARKAAVARWAKGIKNIDVSLREAQKLGKKNIAELDQPERKTAKQLTSDSKKAQLPSAKKHAKLKKLIERENGQSA